jgi:hypothetical protein
MPHFHVHLLLTIVFLRRRHGFPWLIRLRMRAKRKEKGFVPGTKFSMISSGFGYTGSTESLIPLHWRELIGDEG